MVQLIWLIAGRARPRENTDTRYTRACGLPRTPGQSANNTLTLITHENHENHEDHDPATEAAGIPPIAGTLYFGTALDSVQHMRPIF